MNLRAWLILFSGSCVFFLSSNSRADDVADQIATIAKTGPGGKGSTAARRACETLKNHGPEILPRLLVAMDTSNTVAANWYRSVFEPIVARARKSDKPRLPLAAFREFVENPQRQGRVRRRLLALLDEIKPGYRRKLLPKLLDDPEFREDAVDAVLARGQAAMKLKQNEIARASFRAAFDHARESRQITKAADRLKSLGDTVSIVDHMGFVTDWYLLGPFDAPGKTGFTTSFPAETKVDLTAKYPGKDRRTLTWKRHRTSDRLGQVNLNLAITSVKEAVGYAYTELNAAKRVDAELRCGADDNITVWLNGKKVFSRLQWLNGTRLDRFTAKVRLKAGKNRVLVKICQGPQHKNPAVPNNWSMQMRFCTKDGKGIALKSQLPPLQRKQ